MKRARTQVRGRRSLLSAIASTSALAALLLAGSGAKADVVKTFDVSGGFQFSALTFAGTIDFDFSNDTATSVDIIVSGLPAYNQTPSLHFVISGRQAVIGASDGNPLDMLTLMFKIPDFATLADFEGGSIAGGQAIFGNGTGFLFNAAGTIKLDPLTDPGAPAPVTSSSVPEASTWAMILAGFAGLALAAMRRRGVRSVRKA